MDAASRMSHTFTNSTWVAVTESEELRFRFDHDRGYGTRQYQTLCRRLRAETSNGRLFQRHGSRQGAQT